MLGATPSGVKRSERSEKNERSAFASGSPKGSCGGGRIAAGTLAPYVTSPGSPSVQVSGDGIQTPKLLVVIGGDASTLEWVRNGLDDKDPATLTAVPVLVIAETGGAASDIYLYCSPESPAYLKPIEAGSTRNEAYVAACAKWLPEIEHLGKQTGTNTTKQLTFFNFDPDPDAENDLTLAIQTALLNDCPDINQEAMLAVAWGESVILQRHLESDAANLLAHTVGKPTDFNPDARPPDDLLQIALQRGDVGVVRTLLDFTSEPSHVIMDELFQASYAARTALHLPCLLHSPRSLIVLTTLTILTTQGYLLYSPYLPYLPYLLYLLYLLYLSGEVQPLPFRQRDLRPVEAGRRQAAAVNCRAQGCLSRY